MGYLHPTVPGRPGAARAETGHLRKKQRISPVDRCRCGSVMASQHLGYAAVEAFSHAVGRPGSSAGDGVAAVFQTLPLAPPAHRPRRNPIALCQHRHRLAGTANRSAYGRRRRGVLVQGIPSPVAFVHRSRMQPRDTAALCRLISAPLRRVDTPIRCKHGYCVQCRTESGCP